MLFNTILAIPKHHATDLYYRNDGGTDNWDEITKITASDAQQNDTFEVTFKS